MVFSAKVFKIRLTTDHCTLLLHTINLYCLTLFINMKLVRLTLAWILFWSGVGVFGWSMWNFSDGWRQKIVDQASETKKVLAKQNQQTEEAWVVEDRVPVEISFPKIDVSVDVVPNQIVDGEWQVAELQANYLIGSGVIGRTGNVVIYAHKRPNLFGNLSQLGPGDAVKIKSTEVSAEYMIVDSRLVKEDAVEVLADTNLKELTVYTCDGWKDEDRLVLKALFVKEESNGFAGLLGKKVPERGFDKVISGR